MDYQIGIDGGSAIGAIFLGLRGKVGGATALMEQGGKIHPVIIAKDLDWALLPAFVRMTHIRNPGATDSMPRELVVPASVILAIVPMEPPATQAPAAQMQPPGSLH